MRARDSARARARVRRTRDTCHACANVTLSAGNSARAISRREIWRHRAGNARREPRRGAPRAYCFYIYRTYVLLWRVGSRVLARRFEGLGVSVRVETSVVCTEKCGSPPQREKATKRPQNHLMTTKNTTIQARLTPRAKVLV